MRHAVYALCLLFAATGITHAQAKPNTLTPKEIADGWVLLFDGETTFGCDAPGCKVENGLLILAGHKELVAKFDVEFCEETEVIFDYRGTGGCGTNSRRLGAMTESEFFATPGIHSPEWATGRRLFHAAAVQSPTNKSGHLVEYFRLRDGVWKYSGGGKCNFIASTHSICFSTDPFERLEIRNVKAKFNLMKPLFNSKDLDGWKEFPGKKSKFTVENGEIRLTNGPGDLQTLGKYKDFILQLECKSNGKHLNSGIFFRCKDGEYQNGYEAQIFNKFSKDATQKYVVEEFDPKTNKLTAKKEVMSSAFDFGTGAIYRRVPARKEMAKDGEWFSMTIVAHGNHFATWVNGVQVVDWTDNRPKSDNPRNGCRLEAGHISIQGHDPTTDLSFRNIRIAEIK